MRRFVRWARAATAIVALLVVVSAVAVVWTVGRRGSSPIEQWVAQQIQQVSAAYLNPKLTFADLDYEFPATVRVKQLRLTADDPENAGKTIDILGANTAEIELAEVPQVGKAIHIASIVLKDPLFQAVALKGTHRLVGFSELIRTKPANPQAVNAPAAPVPPRGVLPVVVSTPPQGPRLSDVIRMRRVELIGGRILYDSRVDGTPTMEIDHITTKLNVEPTADGWYTVQTRIRRDPIFQLAVSGRLNLDNFTAADVVVALDAKLGRENDGYLPPDLQRVLRSHDVQGTLAARVSGSLPVRDYKNGNLEITAALTDANVSFASYRIPVDVMTLKGSMQQRRLTLSSLHVQALHGEADVMGSAALDSPAMAAELRLVVRNMLLDDTIRPGSQAARDPQYGGRVNVQLVAGGMPLRNVLEQRKFPWPAEKWGQGRIALDQARLVHTPVVEDLSRTFTKGKSFITGQSATTQPRGTDRASLVFALRGNAAQCSEITYMSDVFAARGRGTITFDRQLDLMLNAGPLEKMQSMMGPVGNVFGKLTDAVAAYHVTGAMGNPQVEVQLAGGAVSKVGRGVSDGVKGVVGGIEKLGDRITRTDEN
jgi:hypothetical protein